MNGVGTGLSIEIPNFYQRYNIINMKHLMKSEKGEKMFPWYKRFSGTITKINDKENMTTSTVPIIGDCDDEDFTYITF